MFVFAVSVFALEGVVGDLLRLLRTILNGRVGSPDWSGRDVSSRFAIQEAFVYGGCLKLEVVGHPALCSAHSFGGHGDN